MTSYQHSYCELKISTLEAYQPDGKRLTAAEIAERLNANKASQFTPVVLSRSYPDDLMATVLTKDCIVIVEPREGLTFQVRRTDVR